MVIMCAVEYPAALQESQKFDQAVNYLRQARYN